MSNEQVRQSGITHFADDATLQYIAKLEARVKEFEEIHDLDTKECESYKNAIDRQNEQLTASRAQVDRLVEALTTEAGELNLIRACLDGFQECIPKREAQHAINTLRALALAAVENQRRS